MKDIKSVLLDNSFVTRLLKSDDEFHQNVVEYFEYFLNKGITLYLSTIVVSEYAVADNPDNLLSLNSFRILEFDYYDAKISGKFYEVLKGDQEVRTNEKRNVVINDVKLFAQIHNRKIDAFITKDRKALSKNSLFSSLIKAVCIVDASKLLLLSSIGYSLIVLFTFSNALSKTIKSLCNSFFNFILQVSRTANALFPCLLREDFVFLQSIK